MTHFSISQVPVWVKSAIFYQIFPDRFARAAHSPELGLLQAWGTKPTIHGFMGGNLRGILERLDHIQNLGCNALYLCPIFSSPANHRYHTTDYLQIDPLLGTLQDFDDLVEELHRRQMRIVLDGVFNHGSRASYAFASLLEEGKQSPFVDWFHIHKWPLRAYSSKPNYACWWGLPALPKWKTSNPQVREFLWSVAEFWTKRGIDGWRLDVPNEIDDDAFWQEFRVRVKNINPEAYIVGEIWEDPSRWLQGDQFDGVMHYPARKAILESLFPSVTGNVAADEFALRLRESHASGFGWSMGLLGSHDTARIADLGKKASERIPWAFALLFTLPASPCIYYGDEVGMLGGADPDNRRAFPWDMHELPAIYDCLRHWIFLRREYPALQIGEFTVESWGQGLLVQRKTPQQCVSCYFAMDQEMHIFMEEYFEVLWMHQASIVDNQGKLLPWGIFVICT